MGQEVGPEGALQRLGARLAPRGGRVVRMTPLQLLQGQLRQPSRVPDQNTDSCHRDCMYREYLKCACEGVVINQVIPSLVQQNSGFVTPGRRAPAAVPAQGTSG